MKLLTSLYSIYQKRISESGTFAPNAHSLLYGCIGFLSFLSIIILSKYYNYLSGSSEMITIEFIDITMSSIGFILIYIFKRHEIKEKED